MEKLGQCTRESSAFRLKVTRHIDLVRWSHCERDGARFDIRFDIRFDTIGFLNAEVVYARM